MLIIVVGVSVSGSAVLIMVVVLSLSVLLVSYGVWRKKKRNRKGTNSILVCTRTNEYCSILASVYSYTSIH